MNESSSKISVYELLRRLPLIVGSNVGKETKKAYFAFLKLNPHPHSHKCCNHSSNSDAWLQRRYRSSSLRACLNHCLDSRRFDKQQAPRSRSNAFAIRITRQCGCGSQYCAWERAYRQTNTGQPVGVHLAVWCR